MLNEPLMDMDDRLELERLRAFVRRLGYLRSHMAGGELAMLDALTDDRHRRTLRALDAAIDRARSA